MIQAKVVNRSISVVSDDPITTGSSGIQVKFSFSGDWGKAPNRNVIFQAGLYKKVVTLTGTRCTVPAELLEVPGENLVIGVVGGNDDSDLLISTVLSNPLKIYEGATAKL